MQKQYHINLGSIDTDSGNLHFYPVKSTSGTPPLDEQKINRPDQSYKFIQSERRVSVDESTDEKTQKLDSEVNSALYNKILSR